MLSGSSLDIVAYRAPNSNSVYCNQCWRTPGDTDGDEQLERDAAIIRYHAEEYADGIGLYCEKCGAEIITPYDEDPEPEYEPQYDEYGQEHEAFEDRPGAFEAESNQEYLNYPLPSKSEQ